MNQNPYQAPEQQGGGSLATPGLRTSKRLKKIDPMSAGMIQAIIMAAFGLLYVPFGLILMFGGFASNNADALGAGVGAGLGIMLFAPILYAILGFIGGIIGAFVYNVAAKFTGGLRLEFENEY
ncbi:hypothetical protein ACFQY0_09545 [Haloferula chungangensis]|uniref:DUF3566 domain-containing protein n=1 Tax=Haloferula chungangensis TaxID=1048331 RepID=A0ABW2L509_9BACT